MKRNDEMMKRCTHPRREYDDERKRRGRRDLRLIRPNGLSTLLIERSFSERANDDDQPSIFEPSSAPQHGMSPGTAVVGEPTRPWHFPSKFQGFFH